MIYRLKYAKSESNFDADFEHPTFKGGIEPGFPITAYTLAINYPDELATTYCSNEEKNQEDDGITDGNED